MYSAVALARQYLNLVGKQDFETAYGLFSRHWKNSHPMPVFTQESKDLDLSAYKRLVGTGQCLDVVRKVSDETVITEASGPSCYIRKSGRPLAALQFRVHQSESSGWQIEDLTAVPYSRSQR